MKQLKNLKLRPWQKYVRRSFETLLPTDRRTIHIVYDPIGRGKTTLSMYLTSMNICGRITNDYAVHANHSNGCILDVTHHLTSSMRAAVEEIKNGEAVSPTVWILSSTMVDSTSFSIDHCQFYSINKKNELVDRSTLIKKLVVLSHEKKE